MSGLTRSNSLQNLAVGVMENNAGLDIARLRLRERQTRVEISDNLKLYNLDELDTSDDVCEGLQHITELGRTYTNVLVELEVTLGEVEYGVQFPKSREFKEKILNYQIKAKSMSKRLRVEETQKERAVHALEKKEEEDNSKRTVLKVQIQVFGDKLVSDLVNYKFTSIEDSKSSIRRFECLLDECFTLLSQAKVLFSVDFQDKFEDVFNDFQAKIRGQIETGKDILSKLILQERRNLNHEKAIEEKLSKDQFLKEQMSIAKILVQEIKLRSDALITKCDSKALSALNDYELLGRSKELTDVDSEMREIFGKFSEVSKVVVSIGDDGKSQYTKAKDFQDAALQARNEYAMELHCLLSKRDVSEEKLKSKEMNFDLAKFSGYDSKLDIYAFRAQFEKLIQPSKQRQYWVDILKNNYLSGAALTLVEQSDDIDDVWKKLTGAYGNMKLLLQNKVSDLKCLDNLDKCSDDEKLGLALAKIINAMTELTNLAKKYDLEYKLYVVGGLEKVVSLLGEDRERRFVKWSLEKSESHKSNSSQSEICAEQTEWENLKYFLEKERSLRERMTLLNKSKESLGIVRPKDTGKSSHHAQTGMACHICGKTGHVVSIDASGKACIDYFSCPDFVNMSPYQRCSVLLKSKFCVQCLVPGVKHDEQHKCYNHYVCPDKSHASFPKGLHVLVCDKHKRDAANLALLEKFKRKVMLRRSRDFADYTKNISLVSVSLTFHSSMGYGFLNVRPDIRHSAIFMLQTISVEGISIRIFFDLGAGDLVVKKSIMDILVELGRARQEVPGPISISGVGDQESVTQHGIYSVCLPLRDGQNVVFSGVCMDRVTTVFPTYDLKDVESDIRSQVKSEGGDLDSMPRLSKQVGGDTDIIIGAKYYYAHPREIWRSKTGLAIFDSSFVSSDGSTGVVVGPHKKFSDIEQDFRQANPAYSTSNAYIYHPSVLEYRNRYINCTNATALGNIADNHDQPCECEQSDICARSYAVRRTPKCVTTFDAIDTAGTDASFRCIDCRVCEKCKKSKRVDAISMNEEVEQAIIERNVIVDVVAGKTSHFLPFVTDPDSRIDPVSQERLALQVYKGSVKRLHDKPGEKDSIIQSEKKLHDLGYVDWVDNLPSDIQDMIRSKVKYIIPWRVVYNSNSVSTPCRLVFDASASARGKCCLNSLLAKGTNNLNNMVMIMIRWLCHSYAFHTDISKMYNTIWLDSAHWRYQLYFWNDELKLGVEPRLKAIKTAIYGVRPSGNVADCGIKKTAEITKLQYPKAYDVMMNDLYVDDTMGGAESDAERLKVIEEFSGALAKGGFNLKGFTLSGMDPPEHLANDDKVSINVGGLVWYPKDDIICLKIPEINFGRKKRGKKGSSTAGVIPDDLTLRNCVSAVYEIFDPLGKVAPLVSGLKIDIRELHLMNLSWDDVLPENFRQIWKSNIEMIQEIRNIRYHRAVIPSDAVGLNCETIDTADASQAMICIAIYIRFKLRDGRHSCQLIFARTKTVPKDLSQPRSEMLAASLNASTGHIVKTALGDKHVKCLKLTDSQVALFWINSSRSKLKMWVRNHSIHINRLAPKEEWRYVRSQDMIADIGTRKGAKVEDVGHASQWINGFDWMRGPESEFPMTSATDILLCSERKREALDECISEVVHEANICQSVVCHSAAPVVPAAVGDRYRYSKYIIDPNKFRFRKVARILGLVFDFIRILRERVGKPPFSFTVCNARDLPGGLIIPSEENEFLTTSGSDADPRYRCTKGLVVKYPDNMISVAMQYFFRKATQEVKHFLPASKYQNISEMKSGILYYTGRILPTQAIGSNDSPTMCDACIDLMKSTFCVPIVDVMSPLAYSLTDEIHWYHPDVMHSGVESILREINRMAFIIGGRGLVKSLKENCARCRYLHKLEVKVAMGPKHNSNLCIAPAFFNTQVDICGPVESYDNVKKRTKANLYLLVFCCSTTGATDIKVMDDYSTDSFLLAFTRFSCRYGYPSCLYPDPGSQLIKGCRDMIISFSNMKYILEVERGIQFFTCPVGSHYVHGKVERKIREVRSSMDKALQKRRLSILQWETLAQQISNSINNLPIGLGSKVESLENLDLLTPNRLLLGRNNNRCPTAPLILSNDCREIIKSNENIFRAWFQSWLISYVPSLVPQPKWYQTNTHITVGDIVLFSKSDKEFEHLYQYGIVTATHTTRDGLVRTVDVTYQNNSERTKRTTTRGVRELVVIHRVDELGISKELFNLASH